MELTCVYFFLIYILRPVRFEAACKSVLNTLFFPSVIITCYQKITIYEEWW